MIGKTVTPGCCTEGHVESNQATKGSPTQDATPGASSGEMPAVNPPQVCHRKVIDQTPAPLYCSDACRLANFQSSHINDRSTPPPTPHLSHQTPWMEITCMMVLRAQGVRHIPLFCLLPLSLPPLLPLPLSQCPHQTPVKMPTSTSLPCMALLLFLPLLLLLPRQQPWLQSLLHWKVTILM